MQDFPVASLSRPRLAGSVGAEMRGKITDDLLSTTDATQGKSAGKSATHSSALAPACPESKGLRERLRELASDLVSTWAAEGMPPTAKTSAGLRKQAEMLVQQATAQPEHTGWTMVTIVSEYWRSRLAVASSGRRLLLLPDCPVAVWNASGIFSGRSSPQLDDSNRSNRQGLLSSSVPQVCGPDCTISKLWAAAQSGGWLVESTSRAVPAIGSLLTGQYDGILGVACLEDLEKAFAMLPAFSLPIAAVPFRKLSALGEPTIGTDGPGCANVALASAIDTEWVLGLLGVASGASVPSANYLPLLQESAGLFHPVSLAGIADRLGLKDAFIAAKVGDTYAPLAATTGMAGEFLTRGGKFLRPFIAIAAFDAVCADRQSLQPKSAAITNARIVRDSVKAAAVAIEVFHKASLIHDDIEDDDQMRYGQPTLHVQRGVPTAINVGDYLLGLGYRIVSGLPGIDAATHRDLVAILADAHMRLAQGQGAELWWRDTAEKRLTPDEALTIYGLKTSPAFEAAVSMGIRLAGCDPSEVGPINRYALHIGTGFQVLNDLKDWRGDLENNRRTAADFLGRRPTVMWALAMEQLSPRDAQRLLELSQLASVEGAATKIDQFLADEMVAEVHDLYEKADVFVRTAVIVSHQRNQAAAAAAACRFEKLREVLEFLLDLAVPEQSADALVT